LEEKLREGKLEEILQGINKASLKEEEKH